MVEIPNKAQEEQIYELMREKAELEEMIVGSMRKEKELLDTITNIASIIYYQSSLKVQDNWLEDMIKRKLFTPDEDELETSEVIRVDDEYIYESPDGGDTVYRRKFGDDEREKIR